MFLISDGTLGVPATMILVEKESEIADARALLIAQGVSPDMITVNPVGPPLAG